MLYSASAVTFVGLLYQLVLSFFIVVCIGILENYKLLTMSCADDRIYCTSTIRLRTAAIDAFAHRFEDGHLLHRLFLRLCKSPLIPTTLPLLIHSTTAVLLAPQLGLPT